MTNNPKKTALASCCLAALAMFFFDSAHAGIWLTNSPMLTIHDGGAATLLQNGKVLIVGGDTNNESTGAAELYDPATGIWRFVGSLHTPRTGHRATLLQNGHVLVAGGFNQNDATGLTYANKAELFDPVSETWTETGAIQTERFDFTATLLLDGKVLIVGGASTDTNTATAEVYDPATGSWTPTANLHEARAYHTATLLPDGQVMVSGGTSNGFGFAPGTRSSIELYNPAQGNWTLAGTMIQARVGHTATLLPNGKVLLAGGITNEPPMAPFSSAEIYDPLTGISNPAASMHSPRAFQTAELLPNGTVLVTGGIVDPLNYGTSGTATNGTEIYDPSSDTWTLTGALNTPRFSQRAVLLPGGQILAVGGATNETASIGLTSTELFDPTTSPSTGSWNFTGSMLNARQNFTATLLPNGKVLVAGGLNDSSCELYDPTTATWTNTGALNYQRFNHQATLLANGKVLVSGSAPFSPVPSELYDPATGIWTTNGPMIGFAYASSAALLHNGKVLVSGDSGVSGVSAQLFDPLSNTWTATGPMITPRTWHKSVVLPSGKVFVVGGMQGTTDLASAEIYDPFTGQWSSAGTTRASSYIFTAAAVLPSGNVLVAGADTNGVPISDLFVPATGAWSAAGATRTNHFQPHLIVLPGGKALITGEPGPPELYDPVSGQWTTTPPMKLERQQDAAVLLANGTFMDIGGSEGGATAEIYDPGLYATNSLRPQITPAALNLNLGDPLTIIGTGFRGASEASSGNWQDSATDYPLVQLRSMANGQSTFLLTTNWSSNSFTSLPVWNFPPGQALVSVFVNGIQSTSSVVNIVVPTPVATRLTNPKVTTNGAFRFAFTNTSGAMLGVLAATNLALPLSNWTRLNGVTEISPGAFEFVDPQATNNAQRFYQIFAP